MEEMQTTEWMGGVFGGAVTKSPNKEKYLVHFLGKKNRYFSKRRYGNLGEAKKHADKYLNKKAVRKNLVRKPYRVVHPTKGDPYIEIQEGKWTRQVGREEFRAIRLWSWS